METDHPDAQWTASRRRNGPAVAILGALAGAAVTAGLAWWLAAEDPPAPEPPRRALSVLVQHDLGLLDIAVSPDGQQLAYTALRDGRSRLYIRGLDRFEDVELPDTEGAQQPFFSPDGSAVGFFAGPHLKWSAGPADADRPPGRPNVVAELSGVPAGGYWGDDGTLVIGGPGAAGLLTVPADGGTPTPITTVDTVSGETAHGWPQWFDEDHLLFTIGRRGQDPRLALLRIETGRIRTLLLADGGGFAVEPNTIIFARRGEIFAATIDPDLLDDEPTAGDDTGSGAGADRDPLTLLPRPVLEGVASSGIGSHGLGRARFAAARDGALVFVPPAVTAGENRLVFVDRDGRSEPIDPVSDQHQTPRLSPDGRRVAFSAVTTILQRDLWLLDLDDGTRHRLTDSAGDNHSPLWSRDGRSITFASSRTGLQQVFRLRLSTPGAAEAILHGDLRTPGSWSPDGRRLAFHEPHPERDRDIWIWRDTTGNEPEPWLATLANERAPAHSPDGRWIAYVSDDADGDQVYVRAASADANEAPLRVSPAGGTEPVWARTGSLLFFRRGRSLYETPIQPAPDGRPAANGPALLFDGAFLADPLGNLPAYDITSDGLFVMMELASRPNVIQIMTGWRPTVFPPPAD